MIQDPIPTHLLDWLLCGDVAVQYQVHRDLLDQERPDLHARLRARIAAEGWGRNSCKPANQKAIGGADFTSPNGSPPITACST